MGQRTMDKPPTKAKPSAEEEHAPDELDAEAQDLAARYRQAEEDIAAAFPPRTPEELDAEAQDRSARLRQLTSDYVGAFYRDSSVENLETAQLLGALGIRGFREKLAAVLARETNAAFGESHGWLLRMWIDSIPATIERRCAAADREGMARGDGIVREAIARDMITTMPADLRTRCPGYPPLTDPERLSAAAEDVGLKIKRYVSEGMHGGELDAIKIGRATLTALRYEGRPDDLLPTEEQKKKRRERYRKKSST